MNRSKHLILAGVVGLGLGWAATARADPTMPAGPQARLPVAVPLAGVYITPVAVPFLVATNPISTISLSRDDWGPCCRVNTSVPLGYSAFYTAAVQYWTYRPDLDPMQ